MSDLFGNKKSIQIGIDEWWFNGRIIQKTNDCRLSPYVSFIDNDIGQTRPHGTKKDAIQYCLDNPNKNPKHLPNDYIG